MLLDNLKEKYLLAKVKSRDKEAFAKTYDLYVDHIFRFIYFKVSNKEEAQDLTSAVFLKAWNHIQTKSIIDEKSLRALIYKIARNIVIDYYRENSSKKNIEIDSEEGGLELIDEKQNPLKEVELKSDLSVLEKNITKLKDEYREIIILRFIEELSISEIANILGKTNGNVRILSYRALRALKELMENQEFTNY